MSHYEGKNDLTPIDVVVKNAETNVACIKARFSLAIKVESEPLDLIGPPPSPPQVDNHTQPAEGEQTPPGTTSTPAPDLSAPERIVLGYLPLEHVVAVEDTCPSPPPASNTTSGAADASKQTTTTTQTPPNKQAEQVDELEMIVTFECGKLSFTFQRDEQRTFLSRIRGVVKLGRFSELPSDVTSSPPCGNLLTVF